MVHGTKFTVVGPKLLVFVICYVRFKEGLSALGVLDEMKAHPEVMKEAFIYTPIRLDASTVEAAFSVQWSELGSTKHTKEKKVVAYWRDFLQDLEGMNKNSSYYGFDQCNNHSVFLSQQFLCAV